MQHDGLGASGHLDRAIRITGIGDVGGIAARVEWWLPRYELEGLAALESVADPVGFRCDLPGIRKKPYAGGIGDAMPVKSGHDAQLRRHRHRQAAQSFPDRTALLDRCPSRTDWQFVAGLELSTLEATKGAQRVGRARAENHGHIDTARDGNVGARALFQEIEGEFLAAFHLEGGPRLAWNAIELGWHLRPRDRDPGVIGKFERLPHKYRLENGSPLRITDEQVGGGERMPVHAAGERDADVIIAGTPEVLDGGGKTRLQNLNGHGEPPRACDCRRRCRG